MSETSDEKLLADYIGGRAECFDRLVHRHQRELFHFLIRFTGSAAVAEDVVQEAFLQVHLSASAFDPARRFKPWLFTIAANKARDWLRGRNRRPEMALDAMVGGEDAGGQRFADFIADEAAGPETAVDDADAQAIVQQVVRAMPENLREVLVLAYFHQFPYRDIADVLGVPLGTVKSRLHAAVAAFSKAYRAATGAENPPNP